MPPEIIAGRYHVERAIGRGGMGTVWLCRDEVLGRGPDFLRSDRNPPGFYEELWAQLVAEGHWAGEIWSTR